MRPQKKFGEADIDGKHPSMSLVTIDLHSGTTGTSYGQKMAQKYKNNDFLHEVTLNVLSVAKRLNVLSVAKRLIAISEPPKRPYDFKMDF